MQAGKGLPRGIGALDRFRIGVTLALILLGGIILVRGLREGLGLSPLIMGAAFIAFGVYRMGFVVRYFRQRSR